MNQQNLFNETLLGISSNFSKNNKDEPTMFMGAIQKIQAINNIQNKREDLVINPFNISFEIPPLPSFMSDKDKDDTNEIIEFNPFSVLKTPKEKEV